MDLEKEKKIQMRWREKSYKRVMGQCDPLLLLGRSAWRVLFLAYYYYISVAIYSKDNHVYDIKVRSV